MGVNKVSQSLPLNLVDIVVAQTLLSRTRPITRRAWERALGKGVVWSMRLLVNYSLRYDGEMYMVQYTYPFEHCV